MNLTEWLFDKFSSGKFYRSRISNLCFQVMAHLEEVKDICICNTIPCYVMGMLSPPLATHFFVPCSCGVSVAYESILDKNEFSLIMAMYFKFKISEQEKIMIYLFLGFEYARDTNYCYTMYIWSNMIIFPFWIIHQYMSWSSSNLFALTTPWQLVIFPCEFVALLISSQTYEQEGFDAMWQLPH